MVPQTLPFADRSVNLNLSDLQIEILQNAGMELHERLRWARERRFKTAKEAARRLGVPYGTYSGHESGTRGVKDEDIVRYAKAYRVPAGWLAFEEGDPSDLSTVTLIGAVGPGAEVRLFEGDRSHFEQVERPPRVTPYSVALEVGENAMPGIANEGWRLYYEERRSPPSEDLFGSLCVVGLDDGRVLVKEIRPGRGPGLYDLYSAPMPPLLDQRVVWAAKVEWIRPR